MVEKSEKQQIASIRDRWDNKLLKTETKIWKVEESKEGTSQAFERIIKSYGQLQLPGINSDRVSLATEGQKNKNMSVPHKQSWERTWTKISTKIDSLRKRLIDIDLTLIYQK